MKNDEDNTDKLKLYWEYFFKAETGTYEKTSWLDLFLAEFLLQLKNGGHPKELIKFCPVSGIVTLVGCELLCGIHRVTSSIHLIYSLPVSHAIDSEQRGLEEVPFASSRPLLSSAEILQKYVLSGVTWRCLVLLRALGVEGLSCCRQLSSVLIWLFGELSNDGPNMGDTFNPYLPTERDRQPIHQLFSNKIWSKLKYNQSHLKMVSPAKVTGLLRPKHRVTTKSPEINIRKKESNLSSESNSSNDDLQIMKRSVSVKVVHPTDDFEYFNSPVKSSDEFKGDYDTHQSLKKKKIKAEDYIENKHKEVINSIITPFDLTLIITDILQELCKTESSLSGSEGSQISMQCISFSLRNLCAFQFGSSPVSSLNYSNQEISEVKLALTELLIVSLDKVLIRTDLCAKLINNGTLPMLLRILEDAVFKLKTRFATKEPLNDNTDCNNIIKFIFGIAYSILAFFYSLLMQCRSVDKIREFTEQFKLYADCQKGGLLRECIELMIRVPAEKRDVVILIKKLVESIGRVISCMKRVRSEVIHSAACPRSKHKVCRQRVLAGIHHHHDILGEANIGLTHATPCCVAILYNTLSTLLIDDEVSSELDLRTKILHVMLNSGVCCCVSPAILMENIVRLMLTHHGVSSLCLTVLEHTVYGDLGASVLMPKVTDQLPCAICEQHEVHQGKIEQRYCSHAMSIQKKNLWSFLIHYNSLLQLDNHNSVLHATVSHLLRITPKCRMEIKYELLFSVIYPTFIVAKHRYIIRQEDTAYFLTVSCLNIFASLLNTVAFAEHFIHKGGLSYVLELVSLPEFSKQCCWILEIAIIVEIFKLMREECGSMYEIGTLSSVKMLMSSLKEMKDKCLKIYRLKLTDDKFEELCDLNKECDSLGRSVKSGLVKDKNLEMCTEEAVEDYVELLKTIWTFWRCCAGLCLCSPLFRRYIVTDELFLDTYRMIKVLFYSLGGYQCGACEMRVIIKILESLLTIQFAVSVESAPQYKELSTRLIRDTFLSERTLWSDPGNVRAVCEMLIRVATTSASEGHVMPPTNKAKLPPLLCTSGSSEVEGSSSEDSLPVPYASDHSEANFYSGDEGYEADIEITKLELTPSPKSKKVSTVNNSDIFGTKLATYTLDCNEYAKSGAVTYPELCIIVVDILTQLIQKLLEQTKESSEQEKNLSLSEVGVSLARACCARLSAAFARPCADQRVAPPLHLIQRLLSGAAANLLTQRSQRLEELQRSILELVQVLASQSIDSSELIAFLHLFKADCPPLDILLGSLSQLVDNVQPNMPDCILSFPVERFGDDNLECSGELVNLTGSTASSQSHIAENQARKLAQVHYKAGISSCWSRAALVCGVEGAGWAPWVHGFAAVGWIRLVQNTNNIHVTHNNDSLETCDEDDEDVKEVAHMEPEFAHVFSIGQDSLMFELWIDAHSGLLNLKLSRPDTSCDKILCEMQTDCSITMNQWNCVAFNVKEEVCKRKIHIQVTLFINGRECEKVSLPLPGILVRKAMPMSVLIGENAPNIRDKPVWLLSNLAVLRTPMLNTYNSMYIAARGGNAGLLTMSQIQTHTPNYPSLITPDLLNSYIDWHQVFELPVGQIRELQHNLLLSFSAQSPTIINLYHQTVSTPTVFSGRVATTAGITAMNSGNTTAMSTIPETLFVVWNGNPLPSRYKGLPPAVSVLGGPDVFLYLFARVVELKGTPEEQALALSIVLKLCRIDNRLYSQFHDNNSLPMLRTVFATDKCHMSHYLLKVILDEACSSPVLVNYGGTFFVIRNDAVIIEPKYLIFLIDAWKDLDNNCIETDEPSFSGNWRMCERKEDSSMIVTLLLALSVLLGDHSKWNFNMYQANRVHMLKHLLLACTDRFLNGPDRMISPCVNQGLVHVIKLLLPEPTNLADVALVANFLLLMHQASDTFVTHSRDNFYFLLVTISRDESVNARLLNFLNKKRAAKKKSRKKNKKLALDSEPGYVVVDLKPRESESTDPEIIVEDSDLKYREEGGEGTLTEGNDDDVQTTESNEQSLNNEKPNESLITSENSDISLEKSSAPSDGKLESFFEDGSKAICDDELEPQQSEALEVASLSSVVVEGLLKHLYKIVTMMPDNVLTQAVSGALEPEVLIVLCNHRAAPVRVAAVRLLSAMPALTDIMFHHIANQISLYPATVEIAKACAMLITKKDVNMEHQILEGTVPDKVFHRSPPLLALLTCSLHDVQLTRDITNIVLQIIFKASLKTLSELAIVDVVVRSLHKVGSMDPNTPGRDELLLELGALLKEIAVKALNCNNYMQYFQIITDMHHYLTFVENLSASCHWLGNAMRSVHCSLYQAQLDHLEYRLHSSYTTSTSYFTTVLSSAVSLSSDSSSSGIPRSELADRHRTLTERAINFVVSRVAHQEIVPQEIDLVERIYTTLMDALSGVSPKWWIAPNTQWTTLLCNIFQWMISPHVVCDRIKAEALKRAYHSPPNVQQMLTPTDRYGQKKMAICLLFMLKNIHASANPTVELPITDWTRSWALSTQSELVTRVPSESLVEEAKNIGLEDAKRWNLKLQQIYMINDVAFNKESLVKKLTDSAMSITRQVVDKQNTERKSFMEHLRRSQVDAVSRTLKWKKLIDRFTHEQAIWFDAESYPQSWELDPTEGPGRIRVRLRRCHINIDNRFLKNDFKRLAAIKPGPLSYIVSSMSSKCDVSSRLNFMSRVTHVTVADDTLGDLLLNDRYIHFVPDILTETNSETCSDQKDVSTLCWCLDLITCVVTRRWCLREVAVELFMSTGHAQLIAFDDTNDRNAFLKALNALNLPCRSEPESLTEATNQWRNGTITNWEYIMKLNGLGGRSYNDLMQYPVIPFVLANYTSRILDLKSTDTFRDLRKPMAVQEKERETHYINTYNDLRQARREGSSPLLSRQPHHYASLYSNSGAVLHYLLRLPPFTRLFLSYQDNNFDMPDRTFHSLQTTWRLITKDSPTDVKELIPEFYYLPEFLRNDEGLNLGVRQCGLAVDDVELPPWAPDARLFTLIHRQALESPIITDTLPHWIDLVFGYKQTGQPAIDAINVFPACTYYGFEPESLPDDVSRLAAATMVRTYGQAPRQLLRQPHPLAGLQLNHMNAQNEQTEIWAGLEHGRWGWYCGSPCGRGVSSVSSRQVSCAARLYATPAHRTTLVGTRGSILVALPDYYKGTSGNAGLCCVSWGHADGGVRGKWRRDLPPDLLFTVPALDAITTVSTSCLAPNTPVFFGFRSGLILGLLGRDSEGRGLRWKRATNGGELRAHTKAIVDIIVCTAFKVLLSAGEDGLLVLWDLNTLTYIRTIPNRDTLPVTRIAVSDTLCDIASVHPYTEADPKHKSLLRVHTVNATFVASVKIYETVTCICYSNAPEGVSVNCVAVGLDTGGVKLFSSWDLRVVLYIPPLHVGVALVSITYSCDSQTLFTGRTDGCVVAWENNGTATGSGPSGPVRILAPQHIF